MLHGSFFSPYDWCLTWGPDGRPNHAAAGCHSERERWGAEATSPTPPGCSAGDRQRAKVMYQVCKSATKSTDLEKLQSKELSAGIGSML